MEKLPEMTPWRQKMSRAAYDKAVAAGDPDPIGFVAQMMAESRMNPNARSPVGAMGLGQFMPGTAKRFGLKNPGDPLASMDAALKYRAYIRGYNQKRGVTGEDYVWAGYNAGEGRSVKARHGFKETRGYVNRINDYRPQLAQALSAPYDPQVMAGALPPDGQASPVWMASTVGDSGIVPSSIRATTTKLTTPSEPQGLGSPTEAIQQAFAQYMQKMLGGAYDLFGAES